MKSSVWVLGLVAAANAGCLELGDVSGDGGSTGKGGSSIGDGSWQGGGAGGTGGSGGYPGVPPDFLLDGRTYDQQLQYIAWSGSVSLVTIEHKDGTSLPADEGGGSCANGCNEQVTRIEAGSSVWGRFQNVVSFSVQLAHVGDADAGSAIVTACGTVLGTWMLAVPGANTPGFGNLPSPSWVPPVLDECMWEVRGEGGFAYFRAVTVAKNP